MANITHVACQACGAGAKLNAAEGGFTCAYCGTQNLVEQTRPAAPPAYIRPKVPVPKNIEIKKYKKGVRIRYSWFSTKYIALAFFCVFWDGFVLFFLQFALQAPFPFFLIPIGHAAAGLYLTYTTLAGFINETMITVTKKAITVEHSPLPWPGNLSLPVDGLQQLYCQESVRRGKRTTTYTYELYAVEGDGRKVRLLAGLDKPDLAAYLEQQIEGWLQIEDRPVHGELLR